MHSRLLARLVPALATCVLTADALRAQPAPTAAAPRSAPSRWLVGAGVDAVILDGGRHLPGGTVHASYERRLGASRVILRVAGDYWRQTDESELAAYRVTDRAVGGSVLASVALRQSGRFRPYLLGGAGVYHLSQRVTGARTGRGGVGVPDPVNLREVQSRFSPSLTGGTGVDAHLAGRASVFIEARGVLLPNSGRRTVQLGTHPIRGLLLPLTVGLRL